MKSLRNFSNEALLKETKNLVERERQTTLELIECLAEVEVRMLYAEMGYSSLWAFATQYLGLSEGAAQRRIATMVRPDRVLDLAGVSPANKGRNLML